MATVNYIGSVPKLLGRQNYDDWAFAVENFLVLEGLSKCIDGTETDSDKVAKAKAKLVLTLDSALFIHVKEVKTAQELWNKLKNLYDDSGFTRKISLLRSLISLRLENCDSMDSYVNQIIETAQRLRRTGFKIDEEWIGSLLLAGLPEKFAPMIMAIEHSGMSITTDGIKTKLLDMQIDSTAGSAFIGAKSRGRKVQINTMAGNSKVDNFNLKNIKCYKCKQMGHYKNKCPNLSAENKSSDKRRTWEALSTVFLSGKFNKMDWYVDSGASTHLTGSQQWIDADTCKKDTAIQEIMIANKKTIPVTCSGDVCMTTAIGNRGHDVRIKDVLCAPELTTNLLSVSQLIRNGNKVKFESNGCKIFNKHNRLVATAELCNGVYKLNLINVEKCLLVPAMKVSEDVWHRRLGHINYKDLQSMKNGAVEGLEYVGGLNSNKVCEVCCEGKQSRLPFNHIGQRATSVLEVVHADLCGPMEERSIGGSKYFLIFEDDFSRMCFVYFLRNKDETFEYFKEFKAFAENQKGCKIKCLRTDNGGEFCSGSFENFLRKNGIVHQKTNPYTPQQNGMLERMNRSIVEKARCLLFDANLEKRFWAEAVNTAVYLKNRSIARGLRDRTPYELWMKKKPNVGIIRLFGSEVMVQTPREKRSKFDGKSNKMLLMGYSENVKGYRVYDPVKNDVIISRDVVIIEKSQKQEDVVIVSSEDPKESSVSVGDVDNLDNENLAAAETSSEISNNDSDISEYIPEQEPESAGTHGKSRKSGRISKPKKFDDFVTYLTSEVTESERDPLTVEDALSQPDGHNWRKAMSDELQSFEENHAWVLVDVPKGITIVGCKWVFKKKFDNENNVRYRARLVAKGFTQKPGIDFNETFSPVVKHSTLRLLIALSVKIGLEVTHLDVTTAFLNGELKEDIFMSLPEGLDLPENENKVLKLKKAVYGLKQSSRAWYQKVDVFLKELGYRRSKFEPCLYSKRNQKSLTVVALYVDDFFIFSNSKADTDNLKFELGSKFKIKDLGEMKQCLGMRVTINKKHEQITLDQEQYIEEILKRFNMENCKNVSTPIETKVDLSKSDGMDKQVPYQQLIGSLMYLAVLTRPDIAFSVSYLSQFNNCFDERHWKQAKRILRYLKATKSYGLKFSKMDKDLEGYVDADWAADCTDRKSYTGYCFNLCGATVSWESRKQQTVALSSTEAEYMGISEASKEAIYLKNLYSEITGIRRGITIYNDNQSSQKLAVNPIHHKRTKHIDVRHHFIRDAISEGLVKLEYLQTEDMPADILTKGLSFEKHNKFLKQLGIGNVNV